LGEEVEDEGVDFGGFFDVEGVAGVGDDDDLCVGESGLGGGGEAFGGFVDNGFAAGEDEDGHGEGVEVVAAVDAVLGDVEHADAAVFDDVEHVFEPEVGGGGFIVSAHPVEEAFVGFAAGKEHEIAHAAPGDTAVHFDEGFGGIEHNDGGNAFGDLAGDGQGLPGAVAEAHEMALSIGLNSQRRQNLFKPESIVPDAGNGFRGGFAFAAEGDLVGADNAVMLSEGGGVGENCVTRGVEENCVTRRVGEWEDERAFMWEGAGLPLRRTA